MKTVIDNACSKDEDIVKEICKKWLSRIRKAESSPVPKRPETESEKRLRLGLGWSMVGVGIVSAVLGTVHIFHPIFKSDLTFDSKFSCAVDGVRTECVANQLGLGIPLIAVGGLSIGFGGAILHGRFSPGQIQ